MNFIAGFTLMVSASREKESFWFFASLLSKKKQDGEPVMLGLSEMFSEGFPLLLVYVKVFHYFF